MVVVLSNEVTPDLASLAKKVDAFVKENKKAGAEAFVVLMGESSDANKEKLKKLAKENKIEIPLTISAEKKAVADRLKLNDKVKHTVLVYKGQKVAENFARNEITEKDLEAILAAAKSNASP